MSKYAIDVSNIINELFPLFINIIIHIIRSIMLLINHIHQDSLNLKIMSITPHKLIQFEVASKNDNCCFGIKLSKYPSIRLLKIQSIVISIEFFSVNPLTLTFLLSSNFLFHEINPLICNGANIKV